MQATFEVLFILGVFGCAFSHWICDSAQKPCDGLAVKYEYLREGVAGWFLDSLEMNDAASESITAIICLKQNCGAFSCSQDSVCILGTQVEQQTDTEISAKFFPKEDYTNVARNKQTFYSSAFSGIYTGDLAVDGGLTGTSSLFATDTGDVNGWFVVDLNSGYLIKCIRVLGRQDFLFTSFTDATIYAGNTFVENGDFSSYTTVTTVTRAAPSMKSWFVITPTLEEEYRYIAVKRDITQGEMQVTEIEIYA